MSDNKNMMMRTKTRMKQKRKKLPTGVSTGKMGSQLAVRGQSAMKKAVSARTNTPGTADMVNRRTAQNRSTAHALQPNTGKNTMQAAKNVAMQLKNVLRKR